VQLFHGIKEKHVSRGKNRDGKAGSPLPCSSRPIPAPHYPSQLFKLQDVSSSPPPPCFWHNCCCGIEHNADSVGYVPIRAAAGEERSAGSGLCPEALALRSGGGGAFFFDLDKDGDLGIFKVNSDLSRLFGQEDRVFENLGGDRYRDGIGARVKVTAGGTTWLAEKRSSGGCLSQNDPRLLFGLGGSENADRVEVAWPSGKTQILENVPAGKTVTVEEPAR